MEIEKLDIGFSVCKVEDYSLIDFDVPFCFTGRTDEERSLVCPTACVPANVVEREDGWTAFRIRGTLNFSLVGVLSGISAVLADAEIGIFVVSTFNTDYILVKDGDAQKAQLVLVDAGYHIA